MRDEIDCAIVIIGMISEGLCSRSSLLKPYLIVERHRGLTWTGEPHIVRSAWSGMTEQMTPLRCNILIWYILVSSGLH